jgi:phosphohistidine phosphatase SixA
MRSLLTLTILLFILADAGHARYQSDGITTFILVRHAEKVDDSRNPDLSTEGYERAESLAAMFSETDVNAVYSTNLTRTLETVREIAESNDIEIQAYDVQTPEETAKSWIDRHRGGVVFISGHSNTTPTFANALLGKQYFDGPFEESDYSNLLIISVTDSDETRLLHLRY